MLELYASSWRHYYKHLYMHMREKSLRLQIHPTLLRWYIMAGLPALRFTAPQLPMLCPPLPWVDPQRQSFAGFLCSQDYASKLVRANARFRGRRLGVTYLEGVPRKEVSSIFRFR